MTLPAMAAADPGTGPRLVRAIGRWSLTAAIVNGVIGSAIFGMPAEQAALTGAWSPLASLFAALGILSVVLCFAEVGSRFTEAGGVYLYAREAFGSAVGFQAGWLMFWVRVLSMGANLNVFVNYLAQLAPPAGLGLGRAAVMTAMVLIITAINVRGVKQGTWAVNVFTLAKLLPLVFLVVLGLPRVSGEVLGTQAVAEPHWTQAVLLLVFAYGGFESVLIPAGEARDPRRDTAFALLVGLAVIATVYMLVQLVVIGVVPYVGARGPGGEVLHRAPVASAFRTLLGGSGAVLASLAAMISTWGWTVGATLQTPRLLFSMAGRSELPAAFARIHPRFRTPDRSIVTYAAASLAVGLYGSFAWNATISAIVRLVIFASTCAALLVLRRRPGAPPAGFRLAGAAVIAPAGLLFCVWLLSTRTFAQAWILVAVILVGFGLWASTRRAG